MTGKILKWIEKENVKNLDPENEKTSLPKAMGLGALEAFIDSAVLVGAFGIVYSWGSAIKDLIKK